MIENLKRLLNELYHTKRSAVYHTERSVGINRINKQLNNYIASLECAIEILEKIKYEERSIQNGNIE